MISQKNYQAIVTAMMPLLNSVGRIRTREVVTLCREADITCSYSHITTTVRETMEHMVQHGHAEFMRGGTWIITKSNSMWDYKIPDRVIPPPPKLPADFMMTDKVDPCEAVRLAYKNSDRTLATLTRLLMENGVSVAKFKNYLIERRERLQNKNSYEDESAVLKTSGDR